MATTTLTQNPQKITVPANTSEHDIDFSNILSDSEGTALIDWVSGTSVQINCNGVAIDSATANISSAVTKLLLPVRRGINIRYKGGAGSEVFNITILND